MGVPAQQPVTPVAANRPGIALVSAITGLLLVGTIVAAMWTVVEFDRISSGNRIDAARAQMLAEAGVAHVRSIVSSELADVTLAQLIVGSDNTGGTSDDGLLIGYDLTAETEIPAAGVEMDGGRYFVQILPAPGTIGSAQRVLARCTGVTARNASATIDVVLVSTALPGLVTGGNLNINGNPSILGACGGVHAQGNISLAGTPTIDQYVEAEGTVIGSAKDSDGNPIPITSSAPHLTIPVIDVDAQCATADYFLDPDRLVRIPDGTPDGTVVDMEPWSNWKVEGGQWTLSGGTPPTGVYCVRGGDVKISGNPSANISVIATGNIDLAGTPEITAAHPKGLLFLAGGSIDVSGNAKGGTLTNYAGLIYSSEGCTVRGNPSLSGQIICRGGANVEEAPDESYDSSVDGNVDISFDCGGFFEAEKSMSAWYPVFGQ